MGLATHTRGGQVRFGVSATAASAVLYSAVVLLGVGAASPSALDGGSDRNSAVVLIHGHDTAVSGPEQRLPQASPGPKRQRAHPQQQHQTRVGVGSRSSGPRPASGPTQPSAPRGTESKPPDKPSARQPVAPKPVLEVTPPTSSDLPVPEITVPPVTVPALPVPLPEVPSLPQLPGGSDLPG